MHLLPLLEPSLPRGCGGGGMGTTGTISPCCMCHPPQPVPSSGTGWELSRLCLQWQQGGEGAAQLPPFPLDGAHEEIQDDLQQCKV